MSSISNNSLSPVFEVTTATPGRPPIGDAGFSDLFGQVLESGSRTPETQEPVPPAETQETAGAAEQEESEQQETATEQSSSVEASTDSQAGDEPQSEESSEDTVEISVDAESVVAEVNTDAIEVVVEKSEENSESGAVATPSNDDAEQLVPAEDTPEIHDLPKDAQHKQVEHPTEGLAQEIPSNAKEINVQQQVIADSKQEADAVDKSSRAAPTNTVTTTKEQLPTKEKSTSEESGDEPAPIRQLVPDAVDETLPDDESGQHEESAPRRETLVRSAPSSPKIQPSGEPVETVTSVDVKTSVETVQPTVQSSFQVAASPGTELATSSTAGAGSAQLATEPTTSEPELRETPTVDRNRFLGRVSGAFKAAQQRDGRIQVRLSPPELGLLRIELSVQQGSLTASLETETNAARNLILENLPALKERLAEQGIRIETFDVDVREEGRQAPDHELARERHSQQAGRSVRGGTKAKTTATAQQEHQEALAANSFSENDQGLDIRV